MIRYGSVCSGIEAATMAWHPLGWTPAFFSEIAPFPSAVLAHHYGSNLPCEPLSTNGVPNLGDMTGFEEWPDYEIDLLVGGTPCQDNSIGHSAGTGRGGSGMDGSRSGLAFAFKSILARYRPRWFVWENVPNLLCQRLAGGFLRFIRGLAELGYQCVWRVIDARGVRIADQPRRRLFVVGYLGDHRPAAAVLLEPKGARRDTPTGAKAAPVLTARGGVALDDRTPCVLEFDGARIATPLEWERAMGFPDNFTNIPWRRKPTAPDGPRYRAIGNSMSVDVMSWIGQRVQATETLISLGRMAA